jgi:hypothetical protein
MAMNATDIRAAGAAEINPWPWAVVHIEGDTRVIEDAEGDPLAFTANVPGSADVAALMAAAPEMQAALASLMCSARNPAIPLADALEVAEVSAIMRRLAGDRP